MKITAFMILLWIMIVKKSQSAANGAIPLKHGSWNGAANDTESQSHLELPYRVSVNQHWIVHLSVTTTILSSDKAAATWTASATQVLPYEATEAPPLRVEESLLLFQQTAPLYSTQNSSLYLTLPRSQYDQDTWVIQLTRRIHDKRENIWSTFVSFPQRVHIPSSQQCAHNNNCKLNYRNSPIANLYFNATCLNHTTTIATTATMVELVTLCQVTKESVRKMINRINKYKQKNTVILLIIFLALSFVTWHNVITNNVQNVTSNHDRLRSHLSRSRGIHSTIVSPGTSPTSHEIRWWSGYPYFDSDETVTCTSQHQDTVAVFNSPPFILRKFSSTIWSSSILLDTRNIKLVQFSELDKTDTSHSDNGTVGVIETLPRILFDEQNIVERQTNNRLEHTQKRQDLASLQVRNLPTSAQTPCYHTSCNLSDISRSDEHSGDCSDNSCNYYDQVVSLNHCPITTRMLCVNENSEFIANRKQSNTRSKPTYHYYPSEDIRNRSRSLLVPVWEFIPSPSPQNNTKEETKSAAGRVVKRPLNRNATSCKRYVKQKTQM